MFSNQTIPQQPKGLSKNRRCALGGILNPSVILSYTSRVDVLRGQFVAMAQNIYRCYLIR